MYAFRQSLSKVVGTHAVLRRKSIYTVCYTQYRTPPQSMLFSRFEYQYSSNLTNNGTQHWIRVGGGGGGGDRHLLKLKGFVASVPTHLKLIVGLQIGNSSF
jgi:hypothetical protein